MMASGQIGLCPTPQSVFGHVQLKYFLEMISTSFRNVRKALAVSRDSGGMLFFRDAYVIVMFHPGWINKNGKFQAVL